MYCSENHCPLHIQRYLDLCNVQYYSVVLKLFSLAFFKITIVNYFFSVTYHNRYVTCIYLFVFFFSDIAKTNVCESLNEN